MCEFSAYIAFNKSTNGQTDIKHEMRREKKLSWMSLLKKAVEKLPPSQRSSLEMTSYLQIWWRSSFPNSIFDRRVVWRGGFLRFGRSPRCTPCHIRCRLGHAPGLKTGDWTAGDGLVVVEEWAGVALAFSWGSACMNIVKLLNASEGDWSCTLNGGQQGTKRQKLDWIAYEISHGMHKIQGG